MQHISNGLPRGALAQSEKENMGCTCTCKGCNMGKYVMHVLDSKKNLVSVAMLENRGYDVVFSEGKTFLQHKTTGKAKR